VSSAVTVATMSPTSVVPDRTGGVGTDSPRIVCPLVTSSALTVTNACSVGTPEIEKGPSGPVVDAGGPTFTVTPASGLPCGSTPRRFTVVPGSGTTDTITSCAVVVLLPRSTATALSVSVPSVVGAVNVYSYGSDVSTNATWPFTMKVTLATATSSD